MFPLVNRRCKAGILSIEHNTTHQSFRDKVNLDLSRTTVSKVFTVSRSPESLSLWEGSQSCADTVPMFLFHLVVLCDMDIGKHICYMHIARNGN